MSCVVAVHSNEIIWQIIIVFSNHIRINFSLSVLDKSKRTSKQASKRAVAVEGEVSPKKMHDVVVVVCCSIKFNVSCSISMLCNRNVTIEYRLATFPHVVVTSIIKNPNILRISVDSSRSSQQQKQIV